MKILVATEKPFAAAAVNGIRDIAEKAGHELALLEKYTDKAQFLEAVADADALIVRSDKVTAEVIAAAPNLKIVVRAGAGFDNLDLAACTERGIVAMTEWNDLPLEYVCPGCGLNKEAFALYESQTTIK